MIWIVRGVTVYVLASFAAAVYMIPETIDGRDVFLFVLFIVAALTTDRYLRP